MNHTIRITVLVDNSPARDNASLLPEHGLSLLVETAHQRILYDMGASARFMENARLLGIDLLTCRPSTTPSSRMAMPTTPEDSRPSSAIFRKRRFIWPRACSTPAIIPTAVEHAATSARRKASRRNTATVSGFCPEANGSPTRSRPSATNPPVTPNRRATASWSREPTKARCRTTSATSWHWRSKAIGVS